MGGSFGSALQPTDTRMHAYACVEDQDGNGGRAPAGGAAPRAHSPPTLLANLWPPSVMPVVLGAMIWAAQAEQAASSRAAVARRRILTGRRAR